MIVYFLSRSSPSHSLSCSGDQVKCIRDFVTKAEKFCGAADGEGSFYFYQNKRPVGKQLFTGYIYLCHKDGAVVDFC